MIYLNEVHITDDMIADVNAVLMGKTLSKGPFNKAVKDWFEDYFFRSKVAFPVANATLGIQLSLEALGVRAGDEVITSPYTFISAISAIHRVGAIPVFVDVGPDYNIDVSKIEAAITANTAAIIGTDMYGAPCDAYKIAMLCSERGLNFVQDAAQSFGAYGEYGNPTGEYADAVIHSFYATKNATAGEGGVVLIRKDLGYAVEDFERLYNCGLRVDWNSDVFGTNARMSELNAALLISQLDKAEKLTQQRVENAEFYAEYLNDTYFDYVSIPDVKESAFHLYPIKYTDYYIGGNPVKTFEREGIQIGSHYDFMINQHQPYTKAFGLQITRNAWELAHMTFCLPVHPYMTKDDLKLVVKLWKETYGN